jgi:hypothetical protein
MEMSGSVMEKTVSVGNSTGRLFTGTHGDGELSMNGHANVSNWPGLSGGEVTGATGSNWRGGNWCDYLEDVFEWIRISDRHYAAHTFMTFDYGEGIRGVRSTTVISDKLLRKKDSNNR